MSTTAVRPPSDAAHAAYAESVRAMRASYLDYPMTVSIETFSKCNAACDFCPYPTLERQGERMPTELFRKIIGDLEQIPREHEFSVNLSRVNEPFLDTRLLDMYREVNARLPNASLVFFTNGTPLTARHIDELAALERVKFLILSFNSHDRDEYQRTMQLDYDLVMRKLDLLHDAVVSGKLRFPVTLSRVGDASQGDADFVRFCKSRFPAFATHVAPRADWMGSVNVKVVQPVPRAPCAQWFKLHFLANGDEAFCCIDATGRHGSANVRDRNALDIYNHPSRRGLREALPSRQHVRECKGCVLLA
jgi:hypothetical protein